jgi:lipopolysaccharide transport system permease protein
MTRYTTVIKPHPGWKFINIKEIIEYKDLLFFLIIRGIKAKYAQSVIGIGWAIIQPLFSMIVFTIVFGRLAQIESDGAPYAIFSFAALLPWTYYSNSVIESSGSLLANTSMITKVFFPRLILPLSVVLAKLLDFSISIIVMFFLLFIYQITLTLNVLWLPMLVLIMLLFSLGCGIWLCAFTIQYRDLRYGMSFLIQLLMYVAPVVYPVSYIPERYQLLYALNPMVGIIEGFRSALIGTNPMPWDFILIGTVASICILILGAFYFRRMEKYFADVI